MARMRKQTASAAGTTRRASARQLLVIRAILLVVLIAAAVRPAAAQSLTFRSFGEESGLLDGTIGSLAQDREGFLYAGTENGLYRYDGLRFSRLGPAEGLPENGQVEVVRAAPDGHVWVVFTDRVYRLGAGATLSVALDSRADDEYGHRAAALGSDLLLVRNRRLLRIAPELHPGSGETLSVRPLLADAAPAHDPGRAALDAGFDFVQVEHDHVWASCGQALCRLDGGTVVFGVESGLPADRWTALIRDHAGTIWLRSPGRIASLAPGDGRFRVVEVPGGPGRFAHNPGQLDLVEDSAGRVVTQSAHGLLVHERGHWVVRNYEESFPYSAVTAMLVDREGSLWIGSNGRGLARLVGFGLFESWTREQGLSDDQVWNMSRDGGGTMWVADDFGVDALLDRGDAAVPRTSIVGPGTAQPDDAVSPWHYPFRSFSLARSAAGWLWIGRQDGGLMRRDPRTGRSETVAQLARVRTMLLDPAGPLWIGTNDGLARIDHPDVAGVPAVAEETALTGRIFAMAFDRAGELWVLTEKTLFHRGRRQRWRPVLRTDPEGGYQTRSMLFAPDGTLWLGSFTTGITRLHLDGDAVIGQDRLPSEHLLSRDVEMLFGDEGGRIWIGTDRGLDVTDGAHWRHLDDQDGLVANDIDEHAAFTDDDGTSWFGTVSGLSHVIDTRALFRPIALHPVITRVGLDGPGSSASRPGADPIHLRWSGDPLVIDFTALDFRYERSIRFRYRLRGVDRDWVETTGHEARYPNPPSGRLVFEVSAIDPMHFLGSPPARLVIKMRPPWWNTWPIYVAAAVLVIGTLALLWRARVSYLMVRQRQLEVLVRDRTCEIEQARLILFKQATYDALTGLLNRSAVLEQLRLAMEQAMSSQAPLVLALLDLDHFKCINDSFGHLAGDAVLGEVGRRLLAGTRESDQAGRYGGEEFLLVLPGLRQGTFERIEALREAVFGEPIPFEDGMIRMTCSMGVTWMQPGDDVVSMIRRADALLYAAKRNGRDRIVFDPALALV